MMIKTNRLRALSGSVTLAALCFAHQAHAQTVQLQTPDGSFSINGELISFDDEIFTISIGGVETSVLRSMVECIGDSCPDASLPKHIKTDLVIRGSDTIGDDLMPMLVNGYARSLGAVEREILPAGPDNKINIFPQAGDFEEFAAAIQAAGSSTGFKALINRETDISMSSRPARSSEIKAIAEQGRGNLVDLSQEYIIAVDSILTIVSPDNPVSQLSMDQMAAIFSGQINNWSAVGGPNMPIRVITRPDSSGTRGVFEDAILKPAGLGMAERAEVIGSNEDIAATVADDPSAIGYVGFAYKDHAKAVDLVSSCGIPMSASAFSAKTEEYPLQRRLRLFVDNSPMDKHKRGLLDFAVSDAADPFVEEAGFIDLSVVPDVSGASAKRIADVNPQAGPANERAVAQDLVNKLSSADRLTTTFRFNTGSSVLDNKALRDLQRMADFLALPENKEKDVIVAGFADSVGDFSFNRQLAQSRADVVARALAQTMGGDLQDNGITLRSESFSEVSPIGCNNTPRGRERNRRVEIWLRG